MIIVDSSFFGSNAEHRKSPGFGGDKRCPSNCIRIRTCISSPACQVLQQTLSSSLPRLDDASHYQTPVRRRHQPPPLLRVNFSVKVSPPTHFTSIRGQSVRLRGPFYEVPPRKKGSFTKSHLVNKGTLTRYSYEVPSCPPPPACHRTGNRVGSGPLEPRTTDGDREHVCSGKRPWGRDHPDRVKPGSTGYYLWYQ